MFDQPLVQTEGLMNSVEYLDALTEGSAREFLLDRGVAHYVRSGVGGAAPIATQEGCDRLWRLRSELNSGRGAS